MPRSLPAKASLRFLQQESKDLKKSHSSGDSSCCKVLRELKRFDQTPDEEILGSEQDKLTISEAIRAYTLDAANAVQAESWSGSLEAGKLADLIVLDRNLLEIPADEIVDTKVLKTVLGGRVVYESKLND